MSKIDPIALADEISIEDVLNDLFDIDVPKGSDTWKTYCPLGHEHSDAGRSKAMRIYTESNSAYCFSHRMRFTPVILAQLKFDKSRRRSAQLLLDHYEINYGPRTLEERWNTLGPISDPTGVDESLLRGMFLAHLHTLPGYVEQQYEPEVMDVVNKVLLSADLIDSDASYDTIDEWLTLAKEFIENYWRNRVGS